MNELNLFLALVLKPAVLVLGFLLMKPLWKMREKPGLKLILGSTALFMGGEIMCAVDVYGCQRMTLLNEGLHDTAMMISFAGYILGVMTIASQKRGCFKLSCHQYPNCLLEAKNCEISKQPGSVTWALILMGVVLAILPMLSSPIIHQTLIEAGFGNKVFGKYLYNRTHDLYLLQQIVFPILSIFSFLITLGLILKKGKLTRAAYTTASLALGALSFVYFRVVLINLFHPYVLLTNVGEELIELLFTAILVAWVFPLYRHMASENVPQNHPEEQLQPSR